MLDNRFSIVHNHPSGDPTPSRDDIAITKACAAALEKLDILLHDHVDVLIKNFTHQKLMGILG